MDAHAQEVERLLRKVARMRRTAVAAMLSFGMLVTLGAYLYTRETVVFWLGAGFDLSLLVLIPVILERSADTRKLLKESLALPAASAFHTKGGYFFINTLGVFSERRLEFIPYWGLSAVKSLELDAEARRLTVCIRYFRSGDRTLRIDVPPEVPIEQLGAAVRDGREAAGRLDLRIAHLHQKSRPVEDSTQQRTAGRGRRRK